MYPMDQIRVIMDTCYLRVALAITFLTGHGSSLIAEI